MPIVKSESGGAVITGKGIDLFRLNMLLGALRMELVGMRATRGFSAYATAKREFGLKGSKQKVYEQMLLIVEKANAEYKND